MQALRFQVGLAWAARLPTEFRLLNGLGPVMVGAAAAGDAAAMAAEGHDTNRLMQVRSVLVTVSSRGQSPLWVFSIWQAFEASPDGGTPLCRHIQEVIAKVTPMAAQLRANGQKVALIIATDGEPRYVSISYGLGPAVSVS